MNSLKTLLKSIALAAMCSSLVLATGCSKQASDNHKNTAIVANSGNITVYRYDGGTVGALSHDDDWYSNFLNYYQKEYGGTVTAVAVEWQEWEKKFNNDLASGTAPDLIHLFEKNYYNLLRRDLLVPMEEMTQKGVTGINHPSLLLRQNLAADLYSHNGKTYAFACAYAEADMIFVNEDLFEQYGQTSPYEYYTAGQWNYNTFLECADSMTRDIDGDGRIELNGFYGYDPSTFVSAAGGQLVTLDANGQLVSNLKDKGTLQGLKNYRQLYSGGYTTDYYSRWLNGKVAMVGWLPQNEYSNLANNRLPFEWSMVPFPLDSTNSDGVRPGKCYGWAVTRAGVNWQGCINYVIALNAYEVIEPDHSQPNYSSLFSTIQLEMIYDCTQNIRLPYYNAVGNLKNTQWNMWGALADGKNSFEKGIELIEKEINLQIEAETKSN